jgi:hypothetical protein
MPEKDRRSMKRTAPDSIVSHCWMTGRMAFLSLTLLCLVAAPARSPAQDAGVSGIAPGPGNVNGLNGSIRDPSGIGNAARMPALPQQATPVSPPTVSAPNTTAYRTLPSRGVVRMRRTRLAKSRLAKSGYSRAAVHAAVRENDRLLDRKLTTICRGC